MLHKHAYFLCFFVLRSYQCPEYVLEFYVTRILQDNFADTGAITVIAPVWVDHCDRPSVCEVILKNTRSPVPVS